MHGFLLLGMQLGPAHVGFTTEACLPSPPAGWVQYELTVCLQGGLKSDCRKVPCTTPQACALTGLTPSTKYDVTAVAFKADNSPSLASNSVTVTTSACPTGQVRCGSACIRSSTCCESDSAVGARCSAPLTCPSDGAACRELLSMHGWLLLHVCP